MPLNAFHLAISFYILSSLAHEKFESRKQILLIKVPTVVFCIFLKQEFSKYFWMNTFIFLYILVIVVRRIFIFLKLSQKKCMSSSGKFSYCNRMTPSICLFLFFPLQTAYRWVKGRQDRSHCKEVIALWALKLLASHSHGSLCFLATGALEKL